MHHHYIVIKLTFPALFLPSMALDDNLRAFRVQVEPRHIAPLIDHTVLHALTLPKDVDRVIYEAKEYSFAALCIPPRFVGYATEQLTRSSVGVATVVNFPLANETDAAVCAATADALRHGATEIDMVANPTLVGTSSYVEQIRAVAETIQEYGGKMLKVIIEAGYLSPEGVRAATEAVVAVAAQYPKLRFQTKTSTGMAQEGLLVVKYDGVKKTGARPEDLDIIYNVHRASGLENLGIKAAGGIRSFDDAVVALYAMGARSVADLNPLQHRLGTSSGVSIVKRNS